MDPFGDRCTPVYRFFYRREPAVRLILRWSTLGPTGKLNRALCKLRCARASWVRLALLAAGRRCTAEFRSFPLRARIR
jgi:hypothetical protein